MNIQEFENRTHHGFAQHRFESLQYFTVPAIDATEAFIYGFTSRLGGVSAGDFSSLNLSRTRERNRENKKENYMRAAHALHVEPESLVLVNYEHGDGICAVSPADQGKGFINDGGLPKCDALVVTEPGITAVTLHADCVPVVIVDAVQRVGGVAHAGWKGTAGKLPYKLVEFLVARMGSDPGDLIAAIGPHIAECCFEVGRDVRDVFEEEFGPDTVIDAGGDKAFVSLQKAILLQFMEAHLRPEQVTCADLCTYCRDDLFYSHRRDRGSTGAMGSFLCVLPKQP